MNFQNDISEQYLIKVYDDLQQEQMRLMNSIKNNSNNELMDDKKKQNKITKQITIINNINMNLMKLRNLRVKTQEL